ncbi:MAG: valine--tRNA ligase [Bryobacteraceae bacterium]|nr:valine--tRNA ligase [Bryobacteraceae bacterium]
MQLEKVYEPQRFEPHWAQYWIERGYFHAPSEPDPAKPIFCLVIPPPNVTGSLHIGHMLEHTEIDVTVRWHRMKGDQTLWLPGTDHAGIATQMVVERHLRESQNITRHDLGREEFERRVWQWKDQYGNTILQQMQRIGDSCDWSRNRFTLDEGLSRAVREAFVRLHRNGFIYRGAYMVNWCPSCSTALSDLEVVHEETQGNLWHIRYPVAGHPGRHLTVATTRPETMLGDTGVAIHPSDERYLDLHGAEVDLPLTGRRIPVVCDEVADPEFGTGAVKLTPAHDPNDFEAGKRQNLPHVAVIGKDGKMTAEAGAAYAGLDRFEARKMVLADLDAQGLLAATTPHTLPVSKCQRCKTVVEPLVSEQWFCRMRTLADNAIQAVEDGRTVFVPENWSKTYFEWMRNIRDWCISRQLWWGHRIPAWHCADCGEITVSREDPAACAHCSSANIRQDSDVLDTWFSSGLWPFSTLGWPDPTPEMEAYYPNSLLITGFDILFFWVARMMMLGLEMTGKVPFRTVYIHGLVRDAERQKMSKTKGNTIDPLIVTEQYGTDAVRFALLRGAAPGTDIVLSEERMVSSRAFANKIWNAARFIFLQMEKLGVERLSLNSAPAPAETLEDQWIYHRLNETTARIHKAQENYRYHEVVDLLYGFFWDEFCDWYVELKKLRINTAATPEAAHAHLDHLLRVFETALRLLHPVMPFLTEELWQRLVEKAENTAESICLAAFPQAGQTTIAALQGELAATSFDILKEIVVISRASRSDNQIDPKLRLSAWIETDDEIVLALLRDESKTIEHLTNCTFAVNPSGLLRKAGARMETKRFAITLDLPDLILETRKARLIKEIAELEKVISRSHAQLNSGKFIERAPLGVVVQMKEKLADYEAQLSKSRTALDELS